MTKLDERMRRVGEELDRAAVAYRVTAKEHTYVVSGPARAHRSHVIVTIVVAFAVCVVAAAALRAAGDDRTVNEPPNGMTIAERLGDQQLWPSPGSDVPAETPEQVTREFAKQVLGLSEFTVVAESPDPGGMRIETSTMKLSLVVNRSPESEGGDGRWTIYQLDSPRIELTRDGMVTSSPVGAATADLYVRYANSARALRVTVDARGGVVVMPLQDLLTSAIVVFRNSRGEVIDAASADADAITAHTLVTCTFDWHGESTTATLNAWIGATASASVGGATAHVEVIAPASVGEYAALRLDVNGPPLPALPGFTQNSATSYRTEGRLGRAGDEPVLSGSSTGLGGGLGFSCTAQNPPQSIRDPEGGPRFVPG
jgi:hypothetical protein